MDNRISDEELKKFVELLNEHNGNVASVSRVTGLPPSLLSRRKARAVKRGFLDIKHKVPFGFEVHAVTEQVDADGNVTGKSIKMGDPKGEKFETPKGQRIKGVSALVDSEGNEKIKWIKTETEKQTTEQITAVVLEALENFKPVKPNINPGSAGNDKMMTVYPVLDWHLGMFAWGLETGGPDWDLSIAKKQLVTHFAELVDMSPNSDHCVFMALGDILHADNSQNRTQRSGNVLDVDTRYNKVLTTAVDLLAECLEIVANKHRNVITAFKRGNHDDESTHAIRLAMNCIYKGHKRIQTDDSANSDFFYHRFGKNLIGGTHGDKVKLGQLAITMANHCPQDWAMSKTRHYFTGHVHHLNSKEEGGVTAWTLRAPIPQDVYHSGMAYLSGQSMYAFNYHAEKGSRGHSELEMKFD